MHAAVLQMQGWEGRREKERRCLQGQCTGEGELPAPHSRSSGDEAGNKGES